jgi:5-oxopent-3-ene-1,2,5-tricarboxylate decarboxylase / 2-hydroxyhepta-2,4-diene-1,7-dioate isomerase
MLVNAGARGDRWVALRLPSMGVAGQRLTGIVYGTLLNDPAALAALGDSVNHAPYKAPPRAPVLYLKPRNTLAASGAAVAVPAEPGELEIGASLGLVLGRTACRVDEARALEHLAGYVIVADLSVPHASFYRPSIRFKARDGSCVIGPHIVSRAAVADPDALAVHVSLDGRIVHTASTAGMLRGAARLLADVTEFMTLRRGDILLLGVAFGAPRARAGQSFAIDIEGLGRLDGRLIGQEAIA